MKPVLSCLSYMSVSMLLSSMLLSLASCARDDGSPATVDDDDSGTATSLPGTTVAEGSSGSSGFMLECFPGELRCADELTLEVCDATGLGWTPTQCEGHRTCEECDDPGVCGETRCVGPCDADAEVPSSAGCSFIVNRTLHRFNEDPDGPDAGTQADPVPDGLVVGNPNDELIANIRLFKIPEGQNAEELFDTRELAPRESFSWDIDSTFALGDSSVFRTGGMFRVESDIRVIAYHHAPKIIKSGNDSSMLLPDTALRNDYIVFGYPPHYDWTGRPSYFEVIALEDDTTVRWTPTVETAGNGLPIEIVAPGEEGSQQMNRYDTMRITASLCPGQNPCPEIIYPPTDDPNAQVEALKVNSQDLSGTIIEADKAIWVMSAVAKARVPTRDVAEFGLGRADQLQELLIPIEYWSTEYVCAPAPGRPPIDPFVMGAEFTEGSEDVHWRIFAGRDGVSITSTLPDGRSCDLAGKGSYCSLDGLPNGTVFVVTADGPIMPVQYLQSSKSTAEPMERSVAVGDPAMTQIIPTDQFLSRYVFVTPVGFYRNYVQVTRRAGGAPVMLNGVEVDESLYEPIGDFEFADQPLEVDPRTEQGAFVIESDDPFGIIQYGFHHGLDDDSCFTDTDKKGNPVAQPCNTSYAYPGGMRSMEIVIP